MPEHRIFAAAYNALMSGLEKAGLADKRRELLAQATGATLELGAGTGHNLEHYPPAVDRLVLTEPDPTWPSGCAPRSRTRAAPRWRCSRRARSRWRSATTSSTR